MNGDDWIDSTHQQQVRLHQRLAGKQQAGAISIARPADHSSPSDVQDYRVHMLLSALMLAIALVIANLQ